MIHAITIDCLSGDVAQAAIDLKWYGSRGQFLALFLWRCRPIYTSCMGSAEQTSHCTNATFEVDNQAHERTGASLYNGFSVNTKR